MLGKIMQEFKKLQLNLMASKIIHCKFVLLICKMIKLHLETLIQLLRMFMLRTNTLSSMT